MNSQFNIMSKVILICSQSPRHGPYVILYHQVSTLVGPESMVGCPGNGVTVALFFRVLLAGGLRVLLLFLSLLPSPKHVSAGGDFLSLGSWEEASPEVLGISCSSSTVSAQSAAFAGATKICRLCGIGVVAPISEISVAQLIVLSNAFLLRPARDTAWLTVEICPGLVAAFVPGVSASDSSFSNGFLPQKTQSMRASLNCV